MILPPNWTARNENPETRGTAIVTIYKGDIPWEQFTVPIRDPQPTRKNVPDHRGRNYRRHRQSDKPTATTAESIIADALDDLAQEILGVKLPRSKKRR
jgi:hypothetical protein